MKSNRVKRALVRIPPKYPWRLFCRRSGWKLWVLATRFPNIRFATEEEGRKICKSLAEEFPGREFTVIDVQHSNSFWES